jgi:methionyl-tRNA formyltransferase
MVSTSPLKLYLFIQDEPFHLAKALPKLLDRFPVAGVALFGQKLPKDSWFQVMYRYLCLLGARGLLRMGFHVSFRKLTGEGSLVRLFRKRQLPCRRFRDIQDPSLLDDIRKTKPDILVSIACPQIFREDVLKMAPYGGINLHGGLLPDYPGVMTPFWNLYDGAQEAGCTLHYMSNRIDSGDMIGQRRFSISPEDSVFKIYEKIIQEGITLLIDGLNDIASQQGKRVPLIAKPDRYHTFPSWAQGQAFRKKGLRFF